MNGGSLTSNGTEFSSGVHNYENSGKIVSINNDSTITSTGMCINAYGGTTNINGGVLTCGLFGIASYSSYPNDIEREDRNNFGTINITGGEINTEKHGIDGNGSINMKNLQNMQMVNAVFLLQPFCVLMIVREFFKI